MASLAEGATALRRAAQELPKATQAGITEATLLLTAAVRVGQARAGAGSGRLRGVGASGAAIGVKGDVRMFGPVPVGLVRATGAAHLLDHPTRAHTIVPRRAAALATPQGPRAKVVRPATRGKFYFEEAVAAVEPKVASIVERNIAETLLRLL